MQIQETNDMHPCIIILTHGKAGEELLKSAEMIIGPMKDVFAFSLLPEQAPDEFQKEVSKKLNAIPEGSLVLTDLFGGTPSNCAIMLSKEYNIISVSGVNLAMLIEALNLRNHLTGNELANQLVKLSRESIKNVIKEFITN